MERLVAIPDAGDWVKVSIQGLHRFYQRRTNLVVSSWMTSQDRETAIADNLAYVNGCIEAVAGEYGGISEIIFAGFSQGVAMAFRAAVASGYSVGGLIAVGGDVPPELRTVDLLKIPEVTMIRGTGDTWYTTEKFEDDRRRLSEAGVHVNAPPFDGGHEWPVDLIRLNAIPA